ncbi:IS200/IS605 family accessory protein TnpB-related protein [Thermaerobacter composti]|uniref:IS200/IS605 family accessory protein TnpB-related protein n=1 Tax=Thermaerobacter composti TaxID=554949 RepID=A0ABZ0QS61_9FIRM|nr:IS200/IS605 family accessory protein TnpB-related protein [Thermaerobacter composti]WPD19417.1 IS200/IS605 family accessory protein TnpB-related protein [Thermaerobacter composti]
MQATFQTKIQDRSVYPALDAIAALYGRLLRRLFVDVYVHNRPLVECKREYIAHYGITARHFNALAIELKAKVKAAEEAHRHHLVHLRGQIQSTERAIAKLQKQEKALASGKGHWAALPPEERAERRRRVRFQLHQKQRRLAMLRARLETAEARTGLPPAVCFGSRRLFHRQFHLEENGFASHDEWRKAWRDARSQSFFCIGSKGEMIGNLNCSLIAGSFRLRVPNALAARFGRCIWIHGVRFPYGDDVISRAIATGQAISYRFVRKRGVWYVFATTERPAAPITTSRMAGALGADLNPDRLAVAEVDRFGNPVAARDIRFELQGKRREQVKAILGDVVADLVAWAKGAGKPIVVERLDFREKKARLREEGNRYARMLSAFAYAAFMALLLSRAAREGVEVIRVNPAFTSVIGKVKFMARYGLSPHAAAAVAIARRGLGLGERLRSGTARPLPARNRGRHVWSDWRRIAPSVRGKRAHRLYQRSSEDAPGRGEPRSTRAPAASRPHGPGCDGLAWGPGCDPPARIVGSTVRPAS